MQAASWCLSSYTVLSGVHCYYQLFSKVRIYYLYIPRQKYKCKKTKQTFSVLQNIVPLYYSARAVITNVFPGRFQNLRFIFLVLEATNPTWPRVLMRNPSLAFRKQPLKEAHCID